MLNLQFWLVHFWKAVAETNFRHITYLLYSPYKILFGFEKIDFLKSKFLLAKKQALAIKLARLAVGQNKMISEKNNYANLVFEYIVKYKRIRTLIGKNFDWAKNKAA